MDHTVGGLVLWQQEQIFEVRGICILHDGPSFMISWPQQESQSLPIMFVLVNTADFYNRVTWVIHRLAVLYYRSWWDWSGIGVGWVPTWPSQTPTIPNINGGIGWDGVGLGGMNERQCFLQNLIFQEMFILSPFWKCESILVIQTIPLPDTFLSSFSQSKNYGWTKEAESGLKKRSGFLMLRPAKSWQRGKKLRRRRIDTFLLIFRVLVDTLRH